MLFSRLSARPSATAPGRALPPLLVALSVVAAGCDLHGSALLIEPEFDDVSSFETGLDPWAARSLDLGSPPETFEVARSTDRASDGAQSVRLRLDNPAGQAKVLLERRYETEKDQTYTVDVSFAFASADGTGVPPWRLLAGAAPDSPTKTLQATTPTDTGSGGTAGTFVWVTRSYSFEARTDADAELFVYVGVGGASAGSRAYYVDNVKVVLTRKGISPPFDPGR